jgi:hypothetical protein
MLTIEQCREIDPRLKNLPDELVEKIRDSLYALGQLAFDEWVEDRNVSKIPVGIAPLSKQPKE